MRDPNSSSNSFLVIRTLTGHTAKMSSLTFTTEFELISVSWDKTIRVWLKTNEGIWKLIQVLREHTNLIRVVIKNNEMIFTGGNIGQLIMWKKKEGQ